MSSKLSNILFLLSFNACLRGAPILDVQPILYPLAPGDTQQVTGTIANPWTVDLWITSANVSFDPSILDIDFFPLVIQLPKHLAPGETASVHLLTILVNGVAQSGDTLVTLSLLGGATEFDLDELGVVDLTIRVAGTEVPEPGTLAAVSCGLTAACLFRLRSRTRSGSWRI